MSEFAGFDGVVAAILSAVLASVLTAVAIHLLELRRDKQQRRLKILGWLRWLEFYLDEVESKKLDANLLTDKLPWWADHAMQSCGDSLGLLSEKQREEFIGLLKGTFEQSGMISPETAGPILDKASKLLQDLEKKKWKNKKDNIKGPETEEISETRPIADQRCGK
ncbi:MAG: hypothetical protein QHH00_06025 [Methanomassiliicoccales archaeon]|jgi:hypothetical protein|nr:hypothetical protein [Methanomassiliicoccales archaeon]